MSYNRSNGGAAALSFARRLTNVPYQYGGTAPGPCDCSSLTQWAYEQVGVSLPRTTEAQVWLQRIPNSWASEPGDLLFIRGAPIDANPGHVMVFVAPGIVHGAVFEALETGTLIGQYWYDTDVFEFRTRPALSLPAAPPPPKPEPVLPPAEGSPTVADLAKTHLVGLPNVKAAELAITNGFALYYWSKTHFVPQIGGLPTKAALFANAAYKTKRA